MNTKAVAFFTVAICLAGCSKAVVTIPERAFVQPMPPAPATAIPVQATTAPAPTVAVPAPVQSQSERIAEIDRILSASLTGFPEDTDRRTALRAERRGLMASGNYPMHDEQSARQEPDSHGNFVNYDSSPPSNDQIVIAADSQSGYLPGLEGMTPTERLHYYQALWLQNSQNINVNRNFGFTRRHFRRGF